MASLQEIEKDKASGVRVKLKGNSLQQLQGFVPGPKDSPYDGGAHTSLDTFPRMLPCGRGASTCAVAGGRGGRALEHRAFDLAAVFLRR